MKYVILWILSGILPLIMYADIKGYGIKPSGYFWSSVLGPAAAVIVMTVAFDEVIREKK